MSEYQSVAANLNQVPDGNYAESIHDRSSKILDIDFMGILIDKVYADEADQLYESVRRALRDE